jgi:hypothetical protein
MTFLNPLVSWNAKINPSPGFGEKKNARGNLFVDYVIGLYQGCVYWTILPILVKLAMKNVVNIKKHGRKTNTKSVFLNG